ncbi:putative G-protein coupled receptor 82 [Aplochiton taeniatus]
MENSSVFSKDKSTLSSCVLSLCLSPATLFLLPALYVLLFLTGLPGNALSLWVFLRRISSKSATHVYMIHLSVSNLLLSLSLPFQTTYYSQGARWALRGALCQLFLHAATPMLQINIYVSVFILTWVALSRFAILIQHTHATRPSACTTLLPHAFFTLLRRASFARAMCAAVWVVVVAAIVPVAVYYSINEAQQSDGGGEEEQGGHGREGGREGVCYNAAVEMGGRLSRGASVAAIMTFFTCFLLVLLSYVAVTQHIRRSRRSAAIGGSQRLLGRVLRNIVVIQVVLAVCLLPHHIFKAIFISLVQGEPEPDGAGHFPPDTAGSGGCTCHPLSTLNEVKNFLLCLAALRGSADPVMYFLLDKTFRRNALGLLRIRPYRPSSSQTSGPVSDRASAKVWTVGAAAATPVESERLTRHQSPCWGAKRSAVSTDSGHACREDASIEF